MESGTTPSLRLTYQITPDEVKSALYLSKRLKNRKGKTVMWLVIAGILFVISVVSIIVQPDYKIGYVMAAAMVMQESATLKQGKWRTPQWKSNMSTTKP